MPIPTPRDAVRRGQDTDTRITLLERRLAKGSIPDRLSTTGREITDWDDATETGFYWGIAAANSPARVSGAGTPSWFMGVVTVHPGAGAARISQELREAYGTLQTTTYRRYWNGLTWSAWKPSSDWLPPGTVTAGDSANTVNSAASSWSASILGVSRTMTPTYDMYVDAHISAICKASTGYTMIGLSVTGGAAVTPEQDPDGTARGAYWTPFTSSAVDTQISMIPKRILVPGGQSTTFAMWARRSVGSGVQTCNYPIMTLTPARWA